MFLGSRRKKCRRVKGLLSEYIDGRLNADSVDFVKRHAATCAGCSEELETLRLTVGLFNRVPSVAAPRSFAIREIDVVEARPDRTHRPRALHPTPGVAAASAGIGRGSVFDPERLRWLRPATAVVAVALVVVLAVDFLQVVPQDGRVELQSPVEQAPARVLASPEPAEGAPKMEDAEFGMPAPAPVAGGGVGDGAEIMQSEPLMDVGVEGAVPGEAGGGWPARQIEIAVGAVFVALAAIALLSWRRGRRWTGA
jgi:hypothetical protein